MTGSIFLNEVVEYLAYCINTNIRELEGALISLLAQSSLNKKTITLDLARQMIDKFVKNTSREISIDYIQKVVCDYFNIPIEMIHSKTQETGDRSGAAAFHVFFKETHQGFIGQYRVALRE